MNYANIAITRARDRKEQRKDAFKSYKSELLAEQAQPSHYQKHSRESTGERVDERNSGREDFKDADIVERATRKSNARESAAESVRESTREVNRNTREDSKLLFVPVIVPDNEARASINTNLKDSQGSAEEDENKGARASAVVMQKDEVMNEFGKKEEAGNLVLNDGDEVPCFKCNQMVPLIDIGTPLCIIIEQHSSNCFYGKERKEMPEDKLSTLCKINLELNQLYQCMIRSGCLKSSLDDRDFSELVEICRNVECIAEPSEKDICEVRRNIDFVKGLLGRVSSSQSPTTFLYLERILFCVQVKNAELGKMYNHVEYLYEFNNIRPAIRTTRFSYRMSGLDPNEDTTNDAGRKSERLRSACRNSLSRPSPDAADKKVLRRYWQSLTTRQFYELCEKTMRAMKETNPKAVYADKEKLFEHVLRKSIPSSQWKSAITDLLRDENNDWVFMNSQTNTRGDAYND